MCFVPRNQFWNQDKVIPQNTFLVLTLGPGTLLRWRFKRTTYRQPALRHFCCCYFSLCFRLRGYRYISKKLIVVRCMYGITWVITIPVLPVCSSQRFDIFNQLFSIPGVVTSSERQRFRNQRHVCQEKWTDFHGADIYKQSHAADVWVCNTVQQK